MSTKYFNFNNEADLTQIELNDETGAVQFELDGQVATFETVQEFAEFYAIARNVVPENLKNWTLTEDGTHIAFVLRAGTAGLEADEITALVTGLRAAGMTPAEIGAAVASAQNIQATQAVRPEQVTQIDTQECVSNVIYDLTRNELNKLVLFGIYGVNDVEALKEHIVSVAQQEGLFDRTDNQIDDDEWDEDEWDEDGDGDEEWDNDEDVNDGMLTNETILRINLNTRIRNTISDVKEHYPALPTLTAFRMMAHVTDDSESRTALTKASMVAIIARRSVIIYEVRVENDFATVTDITRNETYMHQLLQQPATRVSYDNGHFYLYSI